MKALLYSLLFYLSLGFAQNLNQVQNIFTSPPTHPAYEVAFSPDGSLLAVALWGDSDSIKILEADSGSQVASLVGHTGNVHSVAFSPDGNFLASASDDNSVKIWNTSDFSLLESLEQHSYGVLSVAFSPDGTFLASASWDKTVKIWNTNNFSLLTSLEQHSNFVTSVAFSPDGDFLASASGDKTVKIWNTSNFSLATSLEQHSNSVYSVAFSPDGDFLASASSDKTVKIWNTSNFSLATSLEQHSSAVWSVAFSPDGDFLASASWDKTVKIWNVNDSYSLVKTIEGANGDGYYVSSVAFHPAGTSLAFGNLRYFEGNYEGVVSLWGTPSRQAVFCPSGCGAVQYVDVTIYSTAGAQVALDGRILSESRTGVFTTQLETGAYQVQASKNGYRSASGTLEARLNGANQLALILQENPQENPPALASLTIRSTAGATVTLDGQALTESSAGVFSGRFGVGSYNISLSKAGYQSRGARVDVLANRSNDFSFPLSGTDPPPPPPVPMAQRKALVIGNNDYVVKPLVNPVNDANAVTTALQNVGFQVLSYTNVNQRSMLQAMADFERSLQFGDIGLIYFAGHGVEIEGTNYLIPTDANPEDAIDLKRQAIALEAMLDTLKSRGVRFSIVILDACRNNPFEAALVRTMGRSSQGLAGVSREELSRDFRPQAAPPVPGATSEAQGIFIAFATEPGMVAQDGAGRHSPYTQTLLQYLHTPNIEIDRLFRSVRSDVYTVTGQEQLPWHNTNIIGEFYFVPQP